jgi:predicted P-loop ATPase
MLYEDYKNKKIWLNWKPVKKDGKITKVPIGSSTDPATWTTYDKLDPKLGKGIVFSREKLLLGIDIDNCLNKDTKEIEHDKITAIETLIEQADTYTEISPSGTGLHLFLALANPFTPIVNKKSPFEIYTSGRFFTVTNNPFDGDKPVRLVTMPELESILSIIGYPWGKTTSLETISETASNLSDGDILNKMFSSKNGEKIKALYNGDLSQHNGDHSLADSALCSHLAFWTGGNRDSIERLWVSSPLGNREKTKRKDYIKSTIDHTLSKIKNFYKPPYDNKDLDLLYQLSPKKDIIYTLNTENICRILRKHPDFQGRFRYDVFKNLFEIRDSGKWREFEGNTDAVAILTEISILFSFFQKVGKEMVYDAIIKVSKENTIDSASDFIKSIVWDKAPRLDKWLNVVYGAPDDILHRAIGSNWIKGLVKRIIEPGCKFDFVLVLEGEQGVKKSTSLAVLGKDWHVETTMSTESKDFFMQFEGKAIIEFSEGETLSRTEVKRMKAIITMQSDKYRPPYERVSRDFPRRCVFAMTTNQSEYLKDETGNRRWLPVRVTLPHANIDWLQNNREQLFAEAYHRIFNLNETIYEFPEKEILEAQQERRIRDPNEGLIANWYYNDITKETRDAGITVFQVYRDALHGKYPSKTMNKYEEMSICYVLKDSLKLIKKQTSQNGIRQMKWYNPKEERVKTEEEVLEDAVYKF